MLRRLSVVTICASLALSGGTAPARKRSLPRRVRVAVLPVQLQGVEPATGRWLGKVVFNELARMGVFRFVSPRRVARKIRLLKRKRLFREGCLEDNTCMRRVGRSLKVSVIYVLQVNKTDEGITLLMRNYDGRTGTPIRKHSERSSSRRRQMEKHARWATRLVSGPMLSTLRPGKGKLRIECSQADAILYLNGKSFGKRTGKTFKVGTGAFDIQVNKDGYLPFREVVVVKARQKHVVKAVLERREEVPDVTGALAAAPAAPAAETPAGKPTAPAPPPPPEEKPAPSGNEDLPAWAVFEKPGKKPKPLVLNRKGAGGVAEAQAALGVKPTSGGESYASSEQVPPPEERKEKRFYQTWWFWTIVGAVVAGGGGTAAYFLLSGGGEQPAAAGTALINWE